MFISELGDFRIAIGSGILIIIGLLLITFIRLFLSHKQSLRINKIRILCMETVMFLAFFFFIPNLLDALFGFEFWWLVLCVPYLFLWYKLIVKFNREYKFN